ncbi:MAG: transposase, family [Actinomycetota bacterium]|nr:transposase, family [Actinomycetota bacterium]
MGSLQHRPAEGWNCDDTGATGPARLNTAAREEIACLTAAGHGPRAIGRAIGRPASTVSRELTRNTGPAGAYRAGSAQHHAEDRAKRPKTARHWPPTLRCGRPCRPGWTARGRRGRSPRDWCWTSPTGRRRGCRTRSFPAPTSGPARLADPQPRPSGTSTTTTIGHTLPRKPATVTRLHTGVTASYVRRSKLIGPREPVSVLGRPPRTGRRHARPIAVRAGSC